jgi:hypothetical protein
MEMVQNFAANEQIDSLPDAARAILRQGLAANPSSGAEIAARTRGYNEVRMWTIRRVLHYVSVDLKMELEAALKEGSS